MLQKSRSKTIAKVKYLAIVPLMLVMLMYVACTDDKLSSRDLNPEEYNYTLTKGDEKSSENDATNYLNFLDENPDYVGWRIVDHEKETIEYSIRSKNEEVPDDYREFQYLSKNGEKRSHYIKEINTTANTAVDIKKVNENMQKYADVPFAVIEQVPVFPGCEDRGTNEANKKCMSEKITEYVTSNFNTRLGKEMGLTGVNRIIAVFQINKNGEVDNIRARAPHPALEEEAKRVLGQLPKMTPGKQGGVEVGVSYSLPIVFEVNK